MKATLAFFQVHTREDKADDQGRVGYVLDGGKAELAFSQQQIEDGIDEVHTLVGNEVEVHLAGSVQVDRGYKVTLVEVRSDPKDPSLYHLTVELPYTILDSRSLSHLSSLLKNGNLEVQIVERAKS